MYNVHLPIMLESERQAVYREREKEREKFSVQFPYNLDIISISSVGPLKVKMLNFFARGGWEGG